MAFHLIANKIKVFTMAYKVLHDLAPPSISFLTMTTSFMQSEVLILTPLLFLEYSKYTYDVAFALSFSTWNSLHPGTCIVSSSSVKSVKPSFPAFSIFSTLHAHTLPCLIFLLCPYRHLMHYNLPITLGY